MVKEVKNRSGSKNFYLSLLKHLNQGLKPIDIANELNISKQRLQYYLSSLKKAGIIKKIGYGAWVQVKEYDPKKVKTSIRHGQNDPERIFTSQANEIRGHAFQFKLKIPKDIAKSTKWTNREEIFNRLGIKYRKLNLFGGGQGLEVRGRKVHITQKSLIVYEKASFIANEAKKSKSYAIDTFKSIIKELENKLKADFSEFGKYKFRVTKAHYSLINNSLAKQYERNGEKLEVYNENGLWFVIDNSFNLHEAEVQQNQEGESKAIDRTEGAKKFMNEMDQTEWQVTPKFILNQMHGIQNNQEVFAKNMQTHIEAVKNLSEAVTELRKEIRNLKNGKF